MKHIYRAATIAAVCSLSFLLATHVFAASITFYKYAQLVVGNSTLYQIQFNPANE